MLDFARMKAEDFKMTDRVEFIEGTADDVLEESLFGAATCMLVLHLR